MYYYTAVVRLQPDTLKRLTSEAPVLLGYLRDRVYVGRTTDPHRRASSWVSEYSHSLGRALRRLANLGYVCYKDYIPMCRTWFCLIGAKNVTKVTWGAPEAAFKMMVARTPNKLHIQAVETNRGRHCTNTPVFWFYNSAKLEAKADRILAKLFNRGK
jgi:hypothetical protein